MNHKVFWNKWGNYAFHLLISLSCASLIMLATYGHIQSTSSLKYIEKGKKISNIPRMDFSGAPKTILLALDAFCGFSIQSAPFYNRLVNEAAKNQNIRLVAIFPNSNEHSQNYLSVNKLNVPFVADVKLNNLGIYGTPTLIVIDNTGIVLDYWRGWLAVKQEAEVVNFIQH